MEKNTVSCKLRISKDINVKTPVFLVDFSNGNLNLKHSNKIEFSSHIPVSISNQHVDSSKENLNDERILRAKSKSSKFPYVSKSNEVSGIGNKCKYFVGVRNKNSGRMKIYESISYHLKPDLNNDIKTNSPVVKNYRERNEDVDSKFGSKGRKRLIAGRQKYSMDSVSLEEAIENISLNKSIADEIQSPSTPLSSNNIDYLPPRNSDAQTVDEVYSIFDIISPDEDDYLNSAADELLASLSVSGVISQWRRDDTFCDYVMKHLEDGSVDNLKAKYLIYHNYLVSFSKLLSSDFKKKDPAQHIPEPIRSCFLDRFTVSSKIESGKIVRNFPQKMKDKLLAYILVIALLIDDYLVNLAHVQRGTKYGLPKITSIAQALGCHIRRQRIDNMIMPIAELKLPLYVNQKYK